MFEPENQGVNCPNCPASRIFFDHKIGYYCMACGRKFTIKEMLVILERQPSKVTPHRR